MWAAALRQAPRMQTPFDAGWWAELLPRRAESVLPEGAPAQAAAADYVLASGATERRQDWGAAPDALELVGRVEELATLRDWVVDERCRLVAVLGIGGIGKTILAARPGVLEHGTGEGLDVAAAWAGDRGHAQVAVQPAPPALV